MPDEPTMVEGDRNVTYILGGQGPAAGAIAAARKDLFEEVGWTVNGPLDGKFAPSTQATLIEQAVLDGTDAIVLDFVFPSQIPAAMESARAADIPVICTQCMPEKSSDGVYMVGTDVNLVAEAESDLVLAAVNKPDATIAVAVDDGISIIKAWQEELVPMLKEKCPGCEIVEVPFVSADIAKPAAPSLVNLLQEYPEGKLDAFIGSSGPSTTSMLNLAEQSGRDDFKIFDTYADSTVATWIKDGEHAPPLYGAVMISAPLMDYATVDTLARIFNDQETTDFSETPILAITQQNAAENLAPSGWWEPEGLKEDFLELWGMTG